MISLGESREPLLLNNFRVNLDQDCPKKLFFQWRWKLSYIPDIDVSTVHFLIAQSKTFPVSRLHGSRAWKRMLVTINENITFSVFWSLSLATTLSYVQQLTLLVQIFTMEMFFNKWFKNGTTVLCEALWFENYNTIHQTSVTFKIFEVKLILQTFKQDVRKLSYRFINNFNASLCAKFHLKISSLKNARLKQIGNLEFSTAVFSEKECAIKNFPGKCFFFSWLHQTL